MLQVGVLTCYDMLHDNLAHIPLTIISYLVY